MNLERAPLAGRTIEVKQEHIDDSDSCDCTWCPVARAIADVAWKNAIIRVDQTSLHVDDWEYKTPREVALFMDRFDGDYETRENARPFSFTMPEGIPVEIHY
jgi:hypothetical protein